MASHPRPVVSVCGEIQTSPSVPSPPRAEKSGRIPEPRCNFFWAAEKMPKDKNEDANAASPFKKNQFCAAFLADITMHQKKTTLYSAMTHPTTDFSNHFPLSKWIR